MDSQESIYNFQARLCGSEVEVVLHGVGNLCQ